MKTLPFAGLEGAREPAVSLFGVVKRYDDVVAVDFLDLEIRAG